MKNVPNYKFEAYGNRRHGPKFASNK